MIRAYSLQYPWLLASTYATSFLRVIWAACTTSCSSGLVKTSADQITHLANYLLLPACMLIVSFARFSSPTKVLPGSTLLEAFPLLISFVFRLMIRRSTDSCVILALLNPHLVLFTWACLILNWPTTLLLAFVFKLAPLSLINLAIGYLYN